MPLLNRIALACLSMVFSTLFARAAFAQESWPHEIPCRVEDGANPDLFVITLGDVKTNLAQGTFDPAADRVTLTDGTTIDNYYRERLGVEFYAPIDKTVFPLPPSGWCTWYYYYPNITAAEVKYNSRWIAENLKDYGAQYVQIDDGWQGSGERNGGRDWSQVHPRRFPDGMQELAAAITAEGLTPGIWLAPHGQSNQQVVDDNKNVFLLDDEGASRSETWEGPFLVDPRTDESHQYLHDLFAKLKDWGYLYYKIDGQPIVVNEYAGKADDDEHELYRKTLSTMRDAIGEESYLLGCWGIPTEGMGIMNGSRTGGDIVRGWQGGFMLAANATMRYFYQHNVTWYTDPDTMVVRSPLTMDQARAWATLQGLTGQALMASDRLMDLSDERVEMLRRVYPAVDARPLDLFPTNGRMKPIWDLKISHLGRDYDVVGVFNYDEDQRQQTKLQWKDFGLDADQLVHVFDFWNQEYLGSWETGMMVDVPPTSVRVLTLLPADEKIQLISTNRHITQGWVDLEELTASDDGKSFAGRSKVIRDDPYDLVFAFPRGEGWAVKTATAETASGPVATEVSNHQGWARVRCMSDETTEIHWRVEFEPADLYYYRPEPVTNLRVAADGLNGATLEWNELYWLNAGYKVYLNGEPLGYTPRSAIALENLDPTVTYTAEVATVWDDGSESERKPEIEFTLASLLPTSVRLTTLEPAPTNEGRRFGGGAATGDLTIGETRFADAILGRSVVYELHGVFARFTAKMGASSAARNDASDNTGGNTTSGAELPKLRFVVVADGKEVFNQEVAADGELHDVDVEIAGAKQLALRIEGEQRAGRRRGRRRGAQVPTSAWIDAQVIRGDAPRGNAAN